MAQRDDLLRRFLDAGLAFTQMTQQRAEGIVGDLVKAGEVQTEQTQQAVRDLLERSRQNTERLVEMVRKEIRDQVSNLGLATKDDIARLERRIDSARATAPAKKSAGTRRPAK